MKVLFDTNVVLDVLLDREPDSQSAIKLLAAVETKQINGYLCATTVTTLDYLLSKSIGKQASKEALNCLLGLFQIAEVNAAVLQSALNSQFTDFEDAVLYCSAVSVNADVIITRNSKDFKLAELPIFEPSEFLAKHSITGRAQ